MAFVDGLKLRAFEARLAGRCSCWPIRHWPGLAWPAIIIVPKIDDCPVVKKGTYGTELSAAHCREIYQAREMIKAGDYQMAMKLLLIHFKRASDLIIRSINTRSSGTTDSGR